MKTKYRNTRKIQIWETPRSLVDFIGEKLDIDGFDIDVAASVSNTKAPRFFTKAQNGLQHNWSIKKGTTNVWCNPPYDDIGTWVEKAVQETFNGVTTVMLIPAATDTELFHNLIVNHAYMIYFLQGRIYFKLQNVGKQSAPHGSMVVVFKDAKHNLRQGHCYMTTLKPTKEQRGLI